MSGSPFTWLSIFFLLTNTIKRFKRFLLNLCFLVLAFSNAKGQSTISITDNHPSESIAGHLNEFIDRSSISSAEALLKSRPFHASKDNVPIYASSIKSVWLQFQAKNASSSKTLYLNIAYPNLSEVSIYKIENGTSVLIGKAGNEVKVSNDISGSPNIIFDLLLPSGTGGEYYVHVLSSHPIMVPAYVSTEGGISRFTTKQTFFVSIYLGVLLIMFLYNFILYFFTKDKNYVYYTTYIILLAFAQLTVAGYSYRYLWPNLPVLNEYAVIWSSTFSAMSGTLFSIAYLQTRQYSPKIHNLLKVVLAIYVVGLICSLFKLSWVSYDILNYNSILSILIILGASIYIARKGFRSAYFYLIAWLTLLLSFLILVLRNLNALPYNNFTAYVFYIGSALEVALLSLALADKINVLRREKELSQAQALMAAQENERLIKGQNAVLETKVSERTEELQLTNQQLRVAFKELKDTQIQLVEAEKMASLGQLTAGIAHEINNPINFVKSNIKPLTLDIDDLVSILNQYEMLHLKEEPDVLNSLKKIDDLKKELDVEFIKSEIYDLLKGIEEGALRTAEIVKGLRIFSRLDESMLKSVDIHEGIDSTLVLLRSTIPQDVKVVRSFNADGNIECYPGKLNQVFMNILNNSVQALKSKAVLTEEDFIAISTKDNDDCTITIIMKDSGPGMSAEVKQKIFDPFFTTKDVGEGTGLGLAIVFKIIQEHNGKIEVNSREGEGAEFVITLPRIIPNKPPSINGAP
ncbi:MAG: hypothetical protein JWQ96_2701 [Segetibacter sp.]|nr:hypothetical protein [Segetibacter sp.]